MRFDPGEGAEIRKTRAALILQNDASNRWSDVTIVAAITSQTRGRIFPNQVYLRISEGGLLRESLVLLNHVRSVDRTRLGRRLGNLSPATMRRVDRALRISLGLAPV